MVQRRYVLVEDRQGTRLPFSKGILSSSVMATGIDPEAAYRLAEAVEDELLASGEAHVSVEHLTRLVENTIQSHLGPGAAISWAAWVEARRGSIPILVFLGGGTGVGKSTVATKLAARLGITRVVATDAIREVMRGTFPEGMMPTLHVSSFEAHRELRAPVPADHDPVVVGFRQQTEVVGVGIRRLVNRAIVERTDLIVEGAHLVPGMFADDWETWSRQAAVANAILSVSDAEAHRAHFLTRLERARGRRPTRYLENFEEIRRIQRYLVHQATAHGVPEVEVAGLDEAIQSVLQLVVDAVIAARARELRVISPGEPEAAVD